MPGIAIAFLLTGQKDLPILMLGAAVTAALAVYCIQWVVTYSKLKADAAYYGAKLMDTSISGMMATFVGIIFLLVFMCNVDKG